MGLWFLDFIFHLLASGVMSPPPFGHIHFESRRFPPFFFLDILATLDGSFRHHIYFQSSGPDIGRTTSGLVCRRIIFFIF